MSLDYSKVQELLGDEAESLLGHVSKTISKDDLHLPGPDFIDRVWISSDRTPSVLRSMQTLANNGRLGGTGYVSILPVDQGIEHSGGASFAIAMQIAEKAAPGSVILCMLPDTGERYLSSPLFEGIPEDMTEEEVALSLSTPGFHMKPV